MRMEPARPGSERRAAHSRSLAVRGMIMDVPTFIAKLVEFLAWPLAAVVLALALRREIRQLLPNIRKLKAGPIEAEFEREIRKLSESVEADTDLLSPPERATPERQMLLQLVQINPRSAILEAWRGVEEAKTVAKSYRIASSYGSPSSSSLDDIRRITTESLFTSEEWDLYVELRTLRNKAAHAPDFRQLLRRH
jgi:hypothetical protein